MDFEQGCGQYDSWLGYWPVRAVHASTQPSRDVDHMAYFFDRGRIENTAMETEQMFGLGFEICYQAHGVRWHSSEFGSSYEVWWVHSDKVRNGPSDFQLVDYENCLLALHNFSSLKTYDEYMDNHMALIFNVVGPIVSRMQFVGERFFFVGQYGVFADLFVVGPTGQIYEALATKEVIVKDYPVWGLCMNRTGQVKELRQDRAVFKIVV